MILPNLPARVFIAVRPRRSRAVQIISTVCWMVAEIMLSLSQSCNVTEVLMFNTAVIVFKRPFEKCIGDMKLLNIQV